MFTFLSYFVIAECHTAYIFIGKLYKLFSDWINVSDLKKISFKMTKHDYIINGGKHVKLLGMQYSMITASEGSSTEMVNNLFHLFAVKFSAIVVSWLCFLQDVGSREKEFGYLSGQYTMELIVGDAVIQNPLSWIFVSSNHSTIFVMVFEIHKSLTMFALSSSG